MNHTESMQTLNPQPLNRGFVSSSLPTFKEPAMPSIPTAQQQADIDAADRLYNVVSIIHKTGIETQLNGWAMTHQQACTYKSKHTEYNWRRLMLKQTTAPIKESTMHKFTPTPSFTFTPEQMRELIESDLEDSGCTEILKQVNDQPEWLRSMGGIQDVTTINGINTGGCDGDAFMPAVTNHLAAETMARHGDDVLQYLMDAYEELPTPKEHIISWSGLAVLYLSCAVEHWCSQFDFKDLTT